MLDKRVPVTTGPAAGIVAERSRRYAGRCDDHRHDKPLPRFGYLVIVAIVAVAVGANPAPGRIVA